MLVDDVNAFAPIPRQRLSDALVARILAHIASGELRVGERLPSILEMARSFGVAATTVREALSRLEERRAVTVRHGSGVFVTSGGVRASSE